jgi:hypothetical protein
MRAILSLSVGCLAILLSGCGGGDSIVTEVASNSAPRVSNSAPTVSAGADISVQEMQMVTLSGIAADADGDALTFQWSQISGPMVSLSDASITNPTFRAPNTTATEEIVLRFTVSDGIQTSSSDVTITVLDTPRDGTSPQGIDDDSRMSRRNAAVERIVVGGVEVRTYDGSSNNLNNIKWGAAFQHLQRLAPNDYADKISKLAGANRVSARVVSNQVHNQAEGESVPNPLNASDFVWQWGQFIDHDLGLTDGSEESADIEIPSGDAFFDPTNTGSAVFTFNRALFDPSTGTDTSNPREQENEITSWIDGSMVYGSDNERAEALRDTTKRHLLATSEGNMLPFNTAGLANANPGSDVLFLAGDVRANEQLGLTVMHTLFVREHNRIAELLMGSNPDADDIFETTRRILVGKIQYITYNEWLPALIGANAIPRYTGYDVSLNPTIYNEFSVAAFRLGHTLLSEDFQRLDAEGNNVDGGPLPLAQAFFTGTRELTEEDDLDPILRGFASQVHQKFDVKIVTDLRNFLFGPPGAGGLDLASFNIQRGRDHGVPSYNAMRTALGLTTLTSFSEVSSDADVVASLEATYDSVNDIDLWTGGLAEDAVSGSQMGELFQTIVVRQFTEIRDADRFWYENYLSLEDQLIIEDTSLATIIRSNTSIGEEISDDVFRVAN